MNNVLMSGHSFGASYSTWGISGASYDQIEQSCETGDGLEEGSCSNQELSIFTSGMLSDDRIKAALPLAGTIRKTFLEKHCKMYRYRSYLCLEQKTIINRHKNIMMKSVTLIFLVISRRCLSSKFCSGSMSHIGCSDRF